MWVLSHFIYVRLYGEGFAGERKGTEKRNDNVLVVRRCGKGRQEGELVRVTDNFLTCARWWSKVEIFSHLIIYTWTFARLGQERMRSGKQSPHAESRW